MSEAYLSGVSRAQQMLLPDSVEQFVSEGNVVRVSDVFVEGLEHGGIRRACRRSAR